MCSSACLSPLDLFASLFLPLPLQLSLSFQLFLLLLLPSSLLLQTFTFLKCRQKRKNNKYISRLLHSQKEIPLEILGAFSCHLLFIWPFSPAPPSPAPPTSPAPSFAAPAEPDVSSPTPGSPSQSSPSSCPQRSLVELQTITFGCKTSFSICNTNF